MPDDGNGPLPEELEQELEQERERFDAEFAIICALLYDGEITLGAWLERFKVLVKVLNIRSALIVAQYLGYEDLPDTIVTRLNEKMQVQHGHARSFAEKILELAALGALPTLAYTLWRGGLYGYVGVGTGYMVWWVTGGEPDDVMIWERHWMDSCPTCIVREGYMAKRSELPFYPKDGSSECDGRCRCSWEVLQRAWLSLHTENKIARFRLRLSLPTKKVLNVRKYKAGYEVRTELIDCSDYGSEDIEMKSAYTPNGDYIGDPRTANFLCKKMGIVPEKAHKNDNVCSVGFCDREQKWYGWSHRAIVGFGIGDRVFEAGYGDDSTPFVRHGKATIKTFDQAREAAVNFADYVG